ncbi:cilia- and flagella-associated protein 298 isoform X2 [Lycorma delicatula]|uniref:cilia- and flagella-associated protein 298 isoform X2 n=1 Tax=Lycorma delicatula TaxID=130591 RepID=UPI003F512043
MVKLVVKRGDEDQFLMETTVSISNDELVKNVCVVYNGRLKISRICGELEELAKHGTLLPPNIMGLTDEQVEELKLKDEWGEKCEPSGGWKMNPDPVGRRNGKQPNEKMQNIIKKSIEEVKVMVSKKQVNKNVCVTQKMVQEALDILKGTVMIVYPMNLPPHDVIRQELENTEDLTGTQASLDVIDVAIAQLWFSGKELLKNKKLLDFVGKNEKTKIIVKLTKMGQGPPAREPVVSEEERKQMMLHAYRRQEELKESINPHYDH